MSELPITQKEYSTATLITDFIVKFKQNTENNSDFKKIKYAPKLNGYTIFFKYSEFDFEIDISKKKNFLSSKIIVTLLKDSVTILQFVSSDNDDNDRIIKEIVKRL